MESHISWSHVGVFREKASGLTGYAVFGVDKVGCGGCVDADVVESVSEAVVERGFGESAVLRKGGHHRGLVSFCRRGEGRVCLCGLQGALGA